MSTARFKRVVRTLAQCHSVFGRFHKVLKFIVARALLRAASALLPTQQPSRSVHTSRVRRGQRERYWALKHNLDLTVRA